MRWGLLTDSLEENMAGLVTCGYEPYFTFITTDYNCQNVIDILHKGYFDGENSFNLQWFNIDTSV